MSKLDFQNLLHKKMTRGEFLGLGVFAAASLFGVAGVLKELSSRAAGANLSAEPEVGTLSGTATLLADVSASSGGAVKFGAASMAKTHGSVPIGTTSYAVPTGAVFVDGTNGNDATGTGTQASSYKTVAVAYEKVAAGGTIVVRGGVYHVGNGNIESQGLAVTKADITIQSYPKEVVWFDGSIVVGGWVASGATWKVNWVRTFDRPYTSVRGAADDTRVGWQWVNPARPTARYPEQVYLDGVQLKQVDSLAACVAGTFFVQGAYKGGSGVDKYEFTSSAVFIGTNPAGHEIRIAEYTVAMLIIADNVTFRGIGVRRYANNINDYGALSSVRAGTLFENVVVQDIAATGMSMSLRGGMTARNVTVERAGNQGINSYQADNLTFDNVRVVSCNSELYNYAPQAGGIKLAELRSVTIKNSEVSNNAGTGFWTDASVYDITVINSDFQNNVRHGILLEISAKALVANNLITGNGAIGLYNNNTNDCRYWNNTVVGNTESDINVAHDPRTPANTSYGHDNRQPQPDPTMTWLITNIQIRNNVIKPSATATGGGLSLRSLSSTSRRDASTFGAVINNNFYNRVNAAQPAVMYVWSRATTSASTYTTLAAFRAATGQEAGGYALDGSNALSADFNLTPATITATSAVATSLPADVAALVGQPVGVKHLGAWR